MAKAGRQLDSAETRVTRGFEWQPHARRILAVWALALVCYSNSFQAGMVADDVPVIQGDARVRAATAANVRLAFTEEYWYGSKTTGLYRPFTTLSYLFNYAILGNGVNPAGYHILNFAIHLGNIALVYLLGLALFSDPLAAVAMAALWGVHPVLTESVTNLVGRADLLAAFGVLAGLLCHIQAAAATGRRKRSGWRRWQPLRPSESFRKRAGWCFRRPCCCTISRTAGGRGGARGGRAMLPWRYRSPSSSGCAATCWRTIRWASFRSWTIP